MKCTDLLRWLLLLVVVVGAPMGAQAQTSQSDTFFAEGRKLRQEGHCAEAIVAFRRSLELDPKGIGSLRNIAECEQQIGRLAAARRSFWDLRRAALQTSDPKYVGWEKDAEKAYDALTPRVPRLTVTLQGNRDGVQLKLDGMPLDPRLLGVEMEEDVGAHTVEARHGAVAPIVEAVTLAEGEKRTITIKIPGLARDAEHGGAASAGALSPRPPESGAASGLFTVGVSSLAVGGLALVGVGISAGVREGALSEVTAACPSLKGCAPELGGAVDRGRTAATLVNVLLGVSGAGLVGGGALLIASRLVTPGAAPSRQKSVSLTVVVSPFPSAPGVWAGGRF